MNNLNLTPENYAELLKSLDILLEDLNPDQLQCLKNISSKINPSNLTSNQALKIIKELQDSGVDIEKLQKKSRRLRAEKLKAEKKPRIKENDKCLCGSQKKYKKCCKNK